MARADQIEIGMRIVIDRPVEGVCYSLQDKDGHPLGPQCGRSGEALAFDFAVRIAPGPKFFGDQVQREEPERRFVYIRVGQLAGDPASLWSRRIKIDIHDLPPDLIACATGGAGRIAITVPGTARDGTPACATVSPISRHIM
ncbi:DUF5990 family protein [Sphingobium sp. CAP-1]|uniref:DUF5990 family protein n=1 Tax=Sphingobium sp. CAP-1 TaxID=2676077 RepID=UPI0012BB2B48|nr:DUF5990 family protein [Sphingobium sp. CAP-1]QGP79065.1 hypothetical protein GL174_08690 [Sphingobium sp. CAP-1]